MPGFVSDDESPVGVFPGVGSLHVVPLLVVVFDFIKSFKLRVEFSLIFCCSGIWFNDWYPTVRADFFCGSFRVESRVKREHAAGKF